MITQRRIKIAYFTHLPNLSGANQSLIDLLMGLKKSRKIEPLVILGRHGILEEKLQEINVAYKVVRYGNEIANSNNLLKQGLKEGLNSLATYRLAKILKEEKVDIIHNNSLLVGIGMRVARKLRLPYIAHLRDFIWEDHGLILEHPKRQEKYLETASKTIAVSEAVRQKYQIGNPNLTIDVIYDGLDCERYLLVDSQRKPLFSDGTLSITMAGRISPGKGQLDAIRAVELLHNRGFNQVKLTIIGTPVDQKYAETIKNYVLDKQLANIEILDYAYDLSQVRAQTDIGLVCSKNEAMGRVTIENMLSGCLTIGANSGGTAELINHKITGLLYEPDNIEELAEQIIYAYQNPQDMIRIQENARSFALSNFNMANYIATMENIYTKLKD